MPKSAALRAAIRPSSDHLCTHDSMLISAVIINQTLNEVPLLDEVNCMIPKRVP